MKMPPIPLPARSVLALALAPLFAAPAGAQAGDAFGVELSDARLALLRAMPGELGTGYGPYFHEDSQGRLLGVLQDERGAPVLQFDLWLAMPLKPWIPTRGVTAEGWVLGELWTPPDAKGERELVGVVQGRWIEHEGYGELSALIFARGDAPAKRRLAGVLTGRYRIEDHQVPVGAAPDVVGGARGKGIGEVPEDEPAGHAALVWKRFILGR